MLLAGVDTIRDVILFPALRPEAPRVSPVSHFLNCFGESDTFCRPGSTVAENRREAGVSRVAWGAGFTTEAGDGATLDAWFRWLGWGEFGDAAPAEVDVALAGGDRPDPTRRVTVRPIRLTIDVDAPPASAADVFLRLHLLSHRLAAPRTLNLDGVFGLLATVAWTDLGPVAAADLDDVRLAVRRDGPHA